MPRVSSRRALISFVAVLAVAAASIVVPSSASAAGTSAAPVPSWQVAAVPAPDGGTIATEDAPELDCPAAAWCQLLSDYLTLTKLSGSTVHSIPAPVHTTDPSEVSALGDLACSGVGECVAVGDYSEGPWDPGHGYRDTLAGHRWRAEDGTTTANGDVGCSASVCVSVGTDDAGEPQGNLDDRTGNDAWVTRGLVTPWQRASDQGFGVSVDSVACPRGTGGCIVLGSALQSFDEDPVPMVFERSGKVWRGVAQAHPAGGTALSFHEHASCAAALRCTTLGTYDDSSGNARLLAETMAGTSVSAQRVPMPSDWVGDYVEASSISCGAIGECAATAYNYDRRTKTNSSILLRLHDGTWSYRRPAVPPHAPTDTDPYVAEVSCATASACVAAGQFARGDSAGTQRAAIWILDDRRWAARRAPAPAGISVGPGDDTSFAHVVCVSAQRCTFTGTAAGKPMYGIARFSG